MEPLVWVSVLAAVLVAVHIVLLVYLYRRAISATADAPARPQDRGPDTPVPALDDPESRVACPMCGTPNDPSYRFCRRCVADLKNSGPAGSGPDATERLGS